MIAAGACDVDQLLGRVHGERQLRGAGELLGAVVLRAVGVNVLVARAQNGFDCRAISGGDCGQSPCFLGEDVCAWDGIERQCGVRRGIGAAVCVCRRRGVDCENCDGNRSKDKNCGNSEIL